MDRLVIASIFKWVATIITLIGALLTSFMIDPLNIYFLNIGAFLFLIWGILIKEKAMILVNSGLLFCYILGLWVRI